MDSSARQRDVLKTEIRYVKGVGPRMAERFATREIRTVGDALYLIPRRYEDRRKVTTISNLVPKEQASFTAEVLDFGARRTGPRKQIFEVMLGDETGKIVARWFRFHPKAFLSRFARGDKVRVAGRVEVYRKVRQLVHPDIEKIQDEQDEGPQHSEDGILRRGDFAAIIPVYPEIEGIYPKTLRKIMRRVVEQHAAHTVEILPDAILGRHDFPPIAQALQEVHFPHQDSDVDQLNRGRSAAHRRVVFEEFFLLQLGLALRRGRDKAQAGHAHPVREDLYALARELFGFELTGAQKRVLSEITGDMASEQPMNRLLQGDVGSGKTAVAVLAATVAAGAGTQTAFMAPTEILAEQHHRNILRLIQDRSAALKVAFLSSAVKGKARREVLEQVDAGEIDLLVGTHALIEEQVNFESLGLCIIDEQHRFGVAQRAGLQAKGKWPDVLVMTATPIPRTLSMTVYGDLDVSILDEMPPGRLPVKTVVLRGSQVKQAYRHVRSEVESGGQAYLVYPLVEESEKMDLRDATQMFERLSQGAFAGLRLGLLHGRMPAEEKDGVMRRFSAGDLDVLVATTVIEVGVDVPRATIMLVEHAERFGLSQLHQLRGRVGRGSRPSTCYLVAHSLASGDARSRLEVMERTNDGFIIAEEDLAIRGPGEFLGTRQSGLPSFFFGNLARDGDLLSQARQDAFSLVEKDPKLANPGHALLKQALWSRWGRRLQFAEVG
jgi:ATP-dependent DNA helicase RecG